MVITVGVVVVHGVIALIKAARMGAEESRALRRAALDEMVRVSEEAGLYDLPPSPDGLLRERIATWLQLNPRQALEAAAEAAQRQIPGHLGTCVSAVLWDHSGDAEPDPEYPRASSHPAVQGRRT